MARLREVQVGAQSPQALEAVIGSARTAHLHDQARQVWEALGAREFLHVNSTAAGGGVAEMLANLLAQSRGLGIDTRWLVVGGDPAFFEVTKRLHNHLYGHPGDGGPLGDAQRETYEQTLAPNADELVSLVRPGDVVALHDPQPAGTASRLREAGAKLVWRCHIGTDAPNEWTEIGWRFLRPYLEHCDAFVFSRPNFIPDWLPQERCFIIQPSLDPLSAKNQPLSDDVVHDILVRAGLLSDAPTGAGTMFVRRDGTRGRVDRPAELIDSGPPPPAGVPIVLQVSRWDRMKDMRGVLTAFAEHVAPDSDAHLMLVGPSVHGVSDDPEGAADLAACAEAWTSLPDKVRRQTHLVCLPLADVDENAAVVNALQRYAMVVLQKSIAEGFGLTVAEAMWKGRPVVATDVGGIGDQVIDGESGLLLADASDLAACGAATRRLIGDPPYAQRLGEAARQRVFEHFLPDRHLDQWGDLLRALLVGQT
ncbi:MAG TPA: glycosyltransferase [Frankiaceae bacterium]|nr:glycosyltransferase [Frankiaceae bacterium]